MFREGVVRALISSGEIDVVAEADNGADALELIQDPSAAGGPCWTIGCRSSTGRRWPPR